MKSCRAVARFVASEEHAEARWWRRLGVALHLAVCSQCRRYAAQLRSIGRAARRALGETQDRHAIEDLKRRILEGASAAPGEPGNGRQD
jgi:hypothetical protein